MYLTGMVDKRTLEKYEREAKEKNRETWYLSWCMDTNQEGKHQRNGIDKNQDNSAYLPCIVIISALSQRLVIKEVLNFRT